MRKKIVIAIVLIAIALLAALIYMNASIETDYTPEPEIEEEENRTTSVSLYFEDIETKTLQVETRLIDSKELLQNPYIKLISLLLDGPNNENFESAIPYGTKLISAIKDGDILIVDFTSEFLASEDPEAKANTIYSVVNTVTELKEISGVKFLVEGKEVEGLNNAFARVK